MDRPTATSDATANLAQLAAGIDADALPPPVRALACQHVLDVLAGLHAGAGIPEAQAVGALFGPAPADRAGVFAMTAHAAEADPIHAGTTICAGLLAVPPALLLARDGPAALAAVVAGYEVAIRIGRALGSSRLLGQGWWPTAVCGGAGAAAAAARAMALDADTVREAIALALVQSGGLGTGGAEAPASRNLLCANTVRLGVEAAEAAARGIAGPREPLTGERGFLGAFGGAVNADALVAGLGKDWAITQTGLKAWPCALQAQTALDALSSLLAGATEEASAVERIEIELPGAMCRIVDRPGPPATRFAAAASLQFLAAAMIVDGDVDPGRMGEANRNNPEVLRIAERISVVAAPDLDVRFPAAWPARVRLTANGTTREAESDTPPGHPDRPAPIEVTEARFRAFSAGMLSAAGQDRLIGDVRSLASLDDPSRIAAAVAAALDQTSGSAG